VKNEVVIGSVIMGCAYPNLFFSWMEQRALVWDGTDENGRSLGSGLYFYQLRAGDYSTTNKMLLLK
jgi:hypothetical protein